MSSGSARVHENLRRLLDAAHSIVNGIPDAHAIDGSTRHRESLELRRAAAGGGRERADLHRQLNHELRMYLVHIEVLLRGVADLWETGMDRERGGINSPALTILLRAALEAAAQVKWLLSDEIDSNDRVRRYLAWRLADLESQRKIVDRFSEGLDQSDSSVDKSVIEADLDSQEDALVNSIERAKWRCRRRTRKPNGNVVPAALLEPPDSTPKVVVVPTNTDLVNTFMRYSGAYALLSVPAHGDRWAILQSISPTGATASDGRSVVKVTGFGMDPSLLKSASHAAIFEPLKALADWNGADISKVRTPIHRLLQITFIDDEGIDGGPIGPE